MAPSPVPVLLIVTIVSVFQAVAVGEVYAAESFDSPVTGDEDWGVLEIVGQILDVIIGTVVLVANFLSFGAFIDEGPPFWISVPVAIAQTGSIAWSIVTLIRGN